MASPSGPRLSSIERIETSAQLARLIRERQAMRVTDAASAVRSARIASEILALVQRLEAGVTGGQDGGALEYLIKVASGARDAQPLADLLKAIRAAVAELAAMEAPDSHPAGVADKAVSHWAALEAAQP